MEMPNPMTANNYDKNIGNVTVVVKSIAQQTMQDACDGIKNKNKNTDMENGVTDTAVSVDSTWLNRGYSSFNGVVAAISIEKGKGVETEALTRYCRGCKVAENFRISDPARCDLWKAEQLYLKNHSGSVAAMEASGAGRIFKISIEELR